MVLLAITVAMVLMVSGSSALSLAADDVYVSIDEARGKVPQHARSQPGLSLSPILTADIAPDDIAARNVRADQLAYRSERVREAAAVVALGGLLVALLTARPGTNAVRARDVNSPIANTNNNATV